MSKRAACPICSGTLCVKKVNSAYHEWAGGWVIRCESCGMDYEGSHNEDTLGGIYDARKEAE